MYLIEPPQPPQALEQPLSTVLQRRTYVRLLTKFLGKHFKTYVVSAALAAIYELVYKNYYTLG
jgi:hypothetical protein